MMGKAKQMVRFGVMLRFGSYEQMARDAILAERSGFDSIWVPDHLVVEDYRVACPETWCTLSAIATCTRRVTLGSSVTDPCRRHPALLAQTIATLDQISHGRALLGLGAGEAMNVEPYGIPWNKRIARMRETVEVLRRLWYGEMVDYNGEVFRLSKAFLPVRPIQKPSPPVYLGANSPKTRRLVGTYADGWMAQMMSPRTYSSDIEEVADAARNVGRSMKDIDVTYVAATTISKDYDEARKAALLRAKQTFLCWPKQLQRYGYNVTTEFDWNKLTVDKDTSKRIEEHIPEVPDEPCEEVSIFGTPEDCINKVEKYASSGVTHFEFEIVGPYEETCRMIGRKILPYFKEDEETHPR